jgi:ABC-type antimicrobial peptide transport system permease subunit
MVLTAAGLALGLLGAAALTRYLSSLLYGVTATDPTTFMVISLLLTVVAAAACYLPARRAAKLDPTYALREE